MQKHKILKTRTNKKSWTIEYKETDKLLYFNDKDGKSIGFMKNPNGTFSVYQNGYKIDSEKHPRLKGSYGYLMAKEQVKLFMDWIVRLPPQPKGRGFRRVV